MNPATRFVKLWAWAIAFLAIVPLSADDCGQDELVTRRISMELVRGASIDDLVAPPPFVVLDTIPEYRLWLLDKLAGRYFKPAIDLLFLPMERDHCRHAYLSEMDRRHLPGGYTQ